MNTKLTLAVCFVCQDKNWQKFQSDGEIGATSVFGASSVHILLGGHLFAFISSPSFSFARCETTNYLGDNITLNDSYLEMIKIQWACFYLL